MENVVVVKDAVKKYRETTALNHVTVSFAKGKIHGIIGRNGSGKTVLFKAVCGFVSLTSGEVSVNGKIVGKEVDMPDNIGMIIETPAFLPDFSGYRNLKYLADIRGRIGKQEIRDAMKLAGLDPDMKKHVGKYSLGMKQRLGIAQAIMEKPDILVLDEPMNGLDNRGVEDIRKLFLSLKETGATILLASHNREDILALCDTVHEMDAGVLTEKEMMGT